MVSGTLAVLALPGFAAAATIEVTTKADHFDGAKCSLRDAIESSNMDTKSGGCAKGSGNDTVVLPEGTYSLLDAPGNGTCVEDANLDCDLDILAPVTIEGSGSKSTIVNANATHERAFQIMNGEPVTFQGMTIRRGFGTNWGGGLEAGSGGAIKQEPGSGGLTLKGMALVDNLAQASGGGLATWSTGPLKISGSTFVANGARDRAGGLLSNQSSRVTITNSRFVQNTNGAINVRGVKGAIKKTTVVGSTGPGIATGGFDDGLSIDESTITGSKGVGLSLSGTEVAVNDSVMSGNATQGQGGGVYVGSGAVEITDSLISNNFAQGQGGGAYLNSGTLAITDSTLSDNGSSSNGGGIYENGGDLDATNSTISHNTAYGGGGGVFAFAGTGDFNNVTIYRNEAYSPSFLSGVGLFVANGSLNFSNSLMAYNRYEGGGAPAYDDCHAGTSAGNNLLSSDANDCSEAGDIVGDSANPVDPLLSPLADNGGPTPTHALQKGSPALGAGGPGCESQDQRHHPRANDCDLGAYEK